MAKIIIFGSGQIAEVIYSYIKNDTDHEVAAFTVDRQYLTQESLFGIPVVAFEEIEQKFPPSEYKMLTAISYKKMNKIREEKYLAAKNKGYSFINYIHSNVKFYAKEIGENNIIFENNVIQPFVKIGNNCILWSGNHIGHHAVIEDHNFISSQVVIAGAAVIGKNCFLGVNATIRDSIKLGQSSLIGAGAIILHDTGDFSVHATRDTPAAKVKSNEIDF
jgi:sugar O-acyltransferase (sialic acid O-acetyltransferase NeuD family)